MPIAGTLTMPKFTFENKFTLGNAIQIAVIVIGGIWAYATLSAEVAAQSKAQTEFKAQVASLDSSVDDILRRLPVVERNQVTGKEAREEGQARTDQALEELRQQNVAILSALAAITARLDERDRLQ